MIKTSQKNIFIKSFLKNRGLDDKRFNLSGLAGDGSTRKFERIHTGSPDQSYIIMDNFPASFSIKKENIAYLKIGKHLLNSEIPVPEIYACDLDEGLFILEDMGDINLQEELLDSEDRIMVYEKVLEILLRIQIMGKDGFNPDWCCQTKVYDKNMMREYEAHYFRDSFLTNYMKLDFDNVPLEKAFNRIIIMADEAEKSFLMHRDFQSRNIMCRGQNQLAILDWQGTRFGPLAYDPASLLFDPYVNLSGYERETLFASYCKMLEDLNRTAVDSLKASYLYIAVMRILQALGAYGNLSMNHGKIYFEQYIPPALNSLKELLEEIDDSKLAYLERIVEDCRRVKNPAQRTGL